MNYKHTAMLLFAWAAVAFTWGLWKMLIATGLFLLMGFLFTLRAKSDGPPY